MYYTCNDRVSDGTQWPDYIFTCHIYMCRNYTPFVVMFQRMARLPIDISHGRHPDPNERLAHYRATAMEKDKETANKERTELLTAIKGNIQKAQANQKRVYDSKHGAGASFTAGSLVMKKDLKRKRRRGGKLDPRWKGPFKITTVLEKGLYSLKSCDGNLTVNRVNGIHLKVFHKVI